MLSTQPKPAATPPSLLLLNLDLNNQPAFLLVKISPVFSLNTVVPTPQLGYNILVKDFVVSDDFILVSWRIY